MTLHPAPVCQTRPPLRPQPTPTHQIPINLAHLKRVGDQIDRAANRLATALAIALVIASLVVGSSIVMTVKGGPTLFGLPAFGFLGFFGAGAGGLWLVRAIWRSSHHKDDQ